jgi:hypothetical protein
MLCQSDGMTSESKLSEGELSLLSEAQSDDVSFDWVLHLLRKHGQPVESDWHPGPDDLDMAFNSLTKLSELGLIHVGRIEYVDEGSVGLAPVRHVEESLPVVRERIRAAIATSRDSADWAYQAWVVAATPASADGLPAPTARG